MTTNEDALKAENDLWANFQVELPTGASIQKNGVYLIVHGATGHKLAGARGRIPFHRLMLWEKLGRPDITACKWCGFVMPWKSKMPNAAWHIVCADHLDGDVKNNAPSNLEPSCAWCNANRNWAEAHTHFWKQWRRWLADVPPCMRPDLAAIASDLGLMAGQEAA